MAALVSGTDAAHLHEALDRELYEHRRVLLSLAQQFICDAQNPALKKDLWACRATIEWLEYCLAHYRPGEGFFPGAGSHYALAADEGTSHD